MKKLEQYIYENIFRKSEINEKLKINKDFKQVYYDFETIKSIVEKYCVEIVNISNMYDRIQTNARDCGQSNWLQTYALDISKHLIDLWRAYKNHWWLDIDPRNMTEGMDKIKNIVDVYDDWNVLFPEDTKKYILQTKKFENYCIITSGTEKYKRVFIFLGENK